MVCGEKLVQISALVKTEHEILRSHHEPVSAEVNLGNSAASQRTLSNDALIEA